jgi:hypothetical protein
MPLWKREVNPVTGGYSGDSMCAAEARKESVLIDPHCIMPSDAEAGTSDHSLEAKI